MPRQADIELEIHAPGLNLHRDRWNYHVMFMEEVHRNLDVLLTTASQLYPSKGRGTIYVGPKQWMEIIEGEWKKSSGTFPCEYVKLRETPHEVNFGALGAGYVQMIEKYDPIHQLILTVLHHPGEMLSAYWIHVPSEI